eukprot:763411-Hanusia_phi.AAC.2
MLAQTLRKLLADVGRRTAGSSITTAQDTSAGHTPLARSSPPPTKEKIEQDSDHSIDAQHDRQERQERVSVNKNHAVNCQPSQENFAALPRVLPEQHNEGCNKIQNFSCQSRQVLTRLHEIGDKTSVKCATAGCRRAWDLPGQTGSRKTEARREPGPPAGRPARAAGLGLTRLRCHDGAGGAPENWSPAGGSLTSPTRARADDDPRTHGVENAGAALSARRGHGVRTRSHGAGTPGRGGGDRRRAGRRRGLTP